MNLLYRIKDTITDTTTEKFETILGLSLEGSNSAIDIFLAGILGGIAQIGKSKKGAENILNLTKEYNFKEYNTSNLNSIFNDVDKTSAFSEKGLKISKSIFENKEDELIDLLVRKCGIAKTAGVKLYSVLTSVIFVNIIDLVRNKKLDTNTLSDTFSSEDKYLSEITPSLKSLFKRIKSEPKIHSIEEFIKKEEKQRKAGFWKQLFR